MDQFGFQRAEDAFHDRVVVAVSHTAHTGCQLPFGQQLLIFVARVLHAAIAVVQQFLCRPTLLESLLKGLTRSTMSVRDIAASFPLFRDAVPSFRAALSLPVLLLSVPRQFPLLPENLALSEFRGNI
jgi:hypothetical protein